MKSLSGQNAGERFVTLVTSALPDAVKAYTPATLEWSVRCPGDTVYRPAGASSHRLYVTFGTPGGPMPTNAPTNRRLNWLCNAAWKADAALEVIEGVDPDGGIGIHKLLDNDPPNDGNAEQTPPEYEVDDWRLMAGIVSPTKHYVGGCDHQAPFMRLAVLLIGGPDGTVYETYPTPDSGHGLGGDPCDPSVPITATAAQLGVTWDIDGNQVVGDESLLLKFDYDGGAGTNINAFEGSIEYSTLGKIYAVWPSLVATSPCGMLLQVRDHPFQNDPPGAPVMQCWVLYVNDETQPEQWVCIRDPATGQLVPEAFPGCSGCP